jgi:hypothetical protein
MGFLIYLKKALEYKMRGLNIYKIQWKYEKQPKFFCVYIIYKTAVWFFTEACLYIIASILVKVIYIYLIV